MIGAGADLLKSKSDSIEINNLATPVIHREIDTQLLPNHSVHINVLIKVIMV